MNHHCECDSPGFCTRHQLNKNQRDFRNCKGISNTGDCGKKYWLGWEQGTLGATAPENPILDIDWECSGHLVESQISKRDIFGQKISDQQRICMVGSRLKELIHDKYGLKSKVGCRCNKRAAEMDKMGCEECERNIDTLVEWLSEGAAERTWIRPIVKVFGGTVRAKAKELIEEAISLEQSRVEVIPPLKTKNSPKDPTMTPKVKSWQYGITATASRLSTLLPRTILSLRKAGFDEPHLFIDGLKNPNELDKLSVGGRTLSSYQHTVHYPYLRTFGNWITALWELYIREPLSQRYVIFQDDMVAYQNLKSYLDNCKYPETGDNRGYWNLYTFPKNQGLVFSRDCVMDLLSSKQNIVERPTTPGRRAWSNIDGGIVTALNKAGWKEYVHNPSLIQHTGQKSSMGGRIHPLAPSFKGEDFDARVLI